MTIIGKSNHPVTVKRIEVRVWALRSEIEAAVAKELAAKNEDASAVKIEDIKKIYEKAKAETEVKTDNVVPITAAADAAATPEAEANPEEKNEETADEAVEAAPADAEVKPEEAAASAEGEKKDETTTPAVELSEEELKRMSFTLPRTIPDEEFVGKGFALISDLNMDEVLLFCDMPFIRGQSVVVEFLIPSKFTLSADVQYSSFYAMRSRIISEDKASHRLQLRWTFAMKGEKTTLRNFLTSVQPDLPVATKAKKKEESEDEEEDFSDLGI
ncbi:MAG: hypothetical protein JNM93_06815 [Bacteriovoracaceae bacterium]|nr:hypothetical protein [Bacteriovoracaceae bacterium]